MINSLVLPEDDNRRAPYCICSRVKMQPFVNENWCLLTFLGRYILCRLSPEWKLTVFSSGSLQLAQVVISLSFEAIKIHMNWGFPSSTSLIQMDSSQLDLYSKLKLFTASWYLECRYTSSRKTLLGWIVVQKFWSWILQYMSNLPHRISTGYDVLVEFFSGFFLSALIRHL